MFKRKLRWFRIGSSEQELRESLPANGIKQILVNRTLVCLVLYNDKLYALKDRCPHQGAKLSDGACTKDGFLVCPWHRYGFDLKNGRGPGYYVDTYRLEQMREGFCIGFEYFSWLGE